MSALWNRMVRAAKLDASLYEEVEADQGAMVQAMTVVILSSVAAGIGNLSEGGWRGIVMATLVALLGWFVWAYLTYLIGTKILPESQTSANPGELLRTIGFSSSPGLLRILALIPSIKGIALAIPAVWMLMAMIVAVRQALDYSSVWRAIGVCIIGWVVNFLILFLFYSILTVA